MGKNMTVETMVYIDGFNLYYRALKRNRKYRWLDLEALCKNILPADSDIKKINFYTARVSRIIDKDAPRKQQIYFNALKTTGIVAIEFGEFRIRKKFAKLTEPLNFRPSRQYTVSPKPNFVQVSVAEEKGSDVKLGVHLVRDGFQKKYQRAVVITNDIDLAEPMRIVKDELNLEVILLKPNSQPLQTLDSNATTIKLIKPEHLAISQFPDKIGKVERPKEWQ